MGNALFLRLLRSLRGATAWLLALGAALLILALWLGALSALAWQDLDRGTGPQLILVLEPRVSERQIDALYLQVRDWEGVGSLAFRFDASTFEGAKTLNVPTQPGLLARLRPGSAPQALAEAAQDLEGVEEVFVLQRERPATLLPSAELKPLLLAAFAVVWLSAVLALRAGVSRTIHQWRGELEMLRLSGVPRRRVLPAFVLVGVTIGALGTLVAVVGLYLIRGWARGSSPVPAYLPLLLEGNRIVDLALAMLVLGLLSGLLAGLWGARAVRRL